jgi:hypothetical protein
MHCAYSVLWQKISEVDKDEFQLQRKIQVVARDQYAQPSTFYTQRICYLATVAATYLRASAASLKDGKGRGLDGKGKGLQDCIEVF